MASKTSFLPPLALACALLPTTLHAQIAHTTDAPPERTEEGAPEPIAFDAIGAKVTADYTGDAIGVCDTGEGACMRTGFQKLEAMATLTGLTVISQADGGGSLQVIAGAYGRGSMMVPLPSTGEVSVHEKLVRFTRPDITEEYSVSADGVRQDFLLAQRPQGEGDLMLDLVLSGAKAEAATVGAYLTMNGSGRKLAYSRLRVTDAEGEELVASMEVLSEDLLALRVQDEGAPYPLRIDPTFSDANWVSMNPTIPGPLQAVYTTAADGLGNLYIGGEFTMVGTMDANYIAKWDGSNWTTMSSGMNGYVYALTMLGADLYAGGSFSTAGGITVNQIAKWDGSSWSALGTGVGGTWPSSVHALTVVGTDLIAGGAFTTAGVVIVNRIAQWNGSSWSALGSGFDNTVRALTVSGTNLLVGGDFSTAGGNAASRIAKWDGTSWTALGTGMNNTVRAIAVVGSDVYAGGDFTTAGGVSAQRIAKWNGSVWSALGSGTSLSVYCLAVNGQDLFVGGNFTQAGGVTRRCIAKWSGTGWSSLDSGLDDDLSGPQGRSALGLMVVGPDLYVGGEFDIAGGIGVLNIAKWNGTVWSALGSGMNDYVTALAVSGSDLYAGGHFTRVGGITANYVAKWNGNTWSALGTGVNRSVDAIAVIGTDVFVGGSFSAAGGTTAMAIARWNGSNWSALAPGMSVLDDVYALAVIGTDLYVGGDFTISGEAAIQDIAKWNGNAWSALGSGTSGSVRALAEIGSDIYAAGAFLTAGGVSVNRIAKWDGSNWSALGSGLNNAAYSLAVSGTDLYAGGAFTNAGGVAASRVAKWNGSAWSSLGSGTTGGDVYAMTMHGTDLYIGGNISTAGGTPARNIARWDGSAWSALGSGANSTVLALDVNGADLYAGGPFTYVGTTVSPFLARAMLGPSVQVNARTVLDGPYNSSTGLMNDALRSLGTFPLTEPYTALGYAHTLGGGETTAAPVLAITGNNAIVDWVVVELRSAGNPTTLVATRSALLQRDGDVVATDGTSPVQLNIGAGNYHVAIRHRNHLGVMTSTALALSPTPLLVDFTTTATSTYGTNARRTTGGAFNKQALWSADATGNGHVKYTGAGNDRDPILLKVGSTTPNNSVTGYWREDVNLDGTVKYTGAANDRDPILLNVGSTTPNSIRSQQLP